MKIIKFLAPLFFANCSVLKDRLLLELARRREAPPRLQWRALLLIVCASILVSTPSLSAADCGRRLMALAGGAAPGVNVWISKGAGAVAAGLAAVNIFGGFLVTQRMLAMYKKKDKA